MTCECTRTGRASLTPVLTALGKAAICCYSSHFLHTLRQDLKPSSSLPLVDFRHHVLNLMRASLLILSCLSPQIWLYWLLEFWIIVSFAHCILSHTCCFSCVMHSSVFKVTELVLILCNRELVCNLVCEFLSECFEWNAAALIFFWLYLKRTMQI